MAEQLILMRHAKSDHDDTSLSDHDRPLASRGIRDTPEMARWFSQQDLVPDLIFTSSSKRTIETTNLMLESWEQSSRVITTEDLYLASPDEILAVLGADFHDVQRAMVVAHNPGISMLASVLSGQSISMPTAAVAVFDLGSSEESPENQLERLSLSSRLTLRHFVTPKTL